MHQQNKYLKVTKLVNFGNPLLTIDQRGLALYKHNNVHHVPHHCEPKHCKETIENK